MTKRKVSSDLELEVLNTNRNLFRKNIDNDSSSTSTRASQQQIFGILITRAALLVPQFDFRSSVIIVVISDNRFPILKFCYLSVVVTCLVHYSLVVTIDKYNMVVT